MTANVNSIARFEGSVNVAGIEKVPFEKPRPNEPFVYEYYASAQPNFEESPLSGKAQVETNQPSWGSYTITCDEGSLIGGKDIAPSPLAYMCSGIALCYLSHITFYLHLVPELKISKCSVNVRMVFETMCDRNAIANDGVSGDSKGIELRVLIESDSPPEAVEKLYSDCIEACAGLQTCVKPIPASMSLDLNGTRMAASTKNL